MQKGKDGHLHPIHSRITETKERERYHQYQLETAAIVWSMNVFKPYLRHKAIPFILRTDCQCLLWLLTTDHDLAIKKWLFQLTEFDFAIEHLRGKDNPSDLMSRQPLPVPQGYFGEAPIENLYSDKHTNIMQYIIDAINNRAEKYHHQTDHQFPYRKNTQRHF